MIYINHERCDVCGACVGVCPSDALIIEIDRLRVDHDVCVKCRACVMVCPVWALSEDECVFGLKNK